jgi:4-hydroxy-3-polyprenylbenzoate decarboxylase
MNQSVGHDELPVVVAITGASGAVYAARLLDSLLSFRVPMHLVVSESGRAVVKQELGVNLKASHDWVAEVLAASDAFLSLDVGEPKRLHRKEAMADFLAIHQPNDYFTPIASGSHLTRGMVICPCSGSTLSGIARSSTSNLIQRAAEVHLKEQRKLIIVPRETPLSVFQLENMHRLAQAGVVVLPAAPGWYHGVKGLADLVDFVVGRILDQLGLRNDQITRWASE